MSGNNKIKVHSYAVEHIPKKIKKFIGNQNIITNIYRIQECNLIVCRYFYTEFTDFMLKGQSFLYYTNLFIFS